MQAVLKVQYGRFRHVQKELGAVYNAYLMIICKVEMYIFTDRDPYDPSLCLSTYCMYLL